MTGDSISLNNQQPYWDKSWKETSYQAAAAIENNTFTRHCQVRHLLHQHDFDGAFVKISQKTETPHVRSFQVQLDKQYDKTFLQC